MNALGQIVASSDVGRWAAAADAVNAWRGAALQCFAEAESAVSEMLLLMGTQPSGASIQLRHLLGQRLEDLRSATAPGGPFAKNGKKAAAALEAFHPHEALRPYLSHGVLKVALDQQGRWVAILKIVTSRGGAVERASTVYDQCEAERALAELRDAGKLLQSALQSLRARLESATSPGEAKE